MCSLHHLLSSDLPFISHLINVEGANQVYSLAVMQKMQTNYKAVGKAIFWGMFVSQKCANCATAKRQK